MRIAKALAILAVVSALAVSTHGVEALTMPVMVGDGDFSDDVYEFRYYPKTATDHNVTLTNAGWTGPFTSGSTSYWQSMDLPLAGDLTMGWDFTGVTRPIAKVELGTKHAIFQFTPWIAHAFEDKIFGDVSTPASFGAGPYTNIYTHTGDGIGAITALAYQEFSEITSLISPGWLNDPGLLELRFAYEQHPIDGTHPDIPAVHLQVFRDSTGTGNVDGFTFRVTLEQEPASVPGATWWGLIGLALALAGLAYARLKNGPPHVAVSL